MNQYIITGGGENHTYGVLPPLFHDLGEYFHSMKGGSITSNDHMAVPMSLLYGGSHQTKKRDYEEIAHDEVIKDELYDKLLELLQVKNNKKTSRKKRKTTSTEVKKQNSTRKNI
jgi:5'-deoxynucleotidase YfbR-like HD superfamily hydrolase